MHRITLTILGLTFAAATPARADVITCGGIAVTLAEPHGPIDCIVSTSTSEDTARSLPPVPLGLPDVIYFPSTLTGSSFDGGLWTLYDPAFDRSNPATAIQRAIDLGIYPNLPYVPAFAGTIPFERVGVVPVGVYAGATLLSTTLFVDFNTDTQNLWSLTLAPTAVPEPSSAVLLGGVAMLAFGRAIIAKHARGGTGR